MVQYCDYSTVIRWNWGRRKNNKWGGGGREEKSCFLSLPFLPFSSLSPCPLHHCFCSCPSFHLPPGSGPWVSEEWHYSKLLLNTDLIELSCQPYNPGRSTSYSSSAPSLQSLQCTLSICGVRIPFSAGTQHWLYSWTGLCSGLALPSTLFNIISVFLSVPTFFQNCLHCPAISAYSVEDYVVEG